MKKFEELTSINSTILNIGGKVFKTVQDPYLVNDKFYKALAVDKHNNTFEIYWEINHKHFNELQDESESCDWENPSSIIRINV